MTRHILPWLQHVAREAEVWADRRSRPRLFTRGGSRAVRALPRADDPGTGRPDERQVCLYRLLP